MRGSVRFRALPAAFCFVLWRRVCRAALALRRSQTSAQQRRAPTSGRLVAPTSSTRRSALLGSQPSICTSSSVFKRRLASCSPVGGARRVAVVAARACAGGKGGGGGSCGFRCCCVCGKECGRVYFAKARGGCVVARGARAKKARRGGGGRLARSQSTLTLCSARRQDRVDLVDEHDARLHRARDGKERAHLCFRCWEGW